MPQAPSHPVHLSVLEELGLAQDTKSNDTKATNTTSCYAVAKTPRYGHNGPYQDAVYVRLTPSAAETIDGKTNLKTTGDLSEARDWTQKWLREIETEQIMSNVSKLLMQQSYSEAEHRKAISNQENLYQRMNWPRTDSPLDIAERNVLDGRDDDEALSTSSFDVDGPGS